ncbi:DDE-type integrase/transposase/recombinase [Pseudomonas taiwanensis]|uniref:Transposase n=1 Tax=Pseudomonas taiwanensis TaxID=470150 RepID=A0ABR6V5K8_9PSED|nr:DDE-type integrase/transposase/recombinase [Pseudomonas taiwanensis]MBC3475773.1 transposase [Pseudomonas taiwanensis]
MNTFEMKVGERYQYRGCRYEITQIRGEHVQLRATEGSKTILRNTLPLLYGAWKSGRLVKVQEAPIQHDPTAVLAGLPKRIAEGYSRRQHYTKPVNDRFPGRLPSVLTQALIHKLAQQINDISAPSLNTVRGWVRKLRLGGERYISLVPKTRTRLKQRIDNQPQEVQQIIEAEIKLHYLNAEPARKTEVIDTILETLDEANEARPDCDKLKVPSSSTLNRILREVDSYEKDLAQKGIKYARRQHHWSVKHSRATHVLQLVEADTQMLHVIIVDQFGEVIGRPYLTAFMDVCTRMICAWTVSFNPPSLDTTLRALRLSLSSDNPYGGVGQRYVFDGGPEYIAENLQRIILMLGGEICYCEPGSPNQKPHIEAFFGTLSKELVHLMPGTTFAAPTDRGDYDSEERAMLQLDELNGFIGRWISEVYAERRHSAIGISPRQAWEKYSNALFQAKRYSSDELNKHFWQAFRATPNQGRLRFDSLFWTGPAVGYLAKQYSTEKKLLVYYDSSNLGKAWVCHPDHREELFELEAVDADYQDGLTLHLHKLIQKRLREDRQTFNSRVARRARVKILREISDIKNKKNRLKRHRIEECKQGMQLKPKNSKLIQRTEPVVDYPYHQDTPDDYSAPGI